MLEFFGDVERFVASLYPYRVPLTLAALVVLGIAAGLAWRMGWVERAAGVVRGRPVASGVALVLVLAVVLPVGWVLASPLWTRTMLVEESPLAMAAQAEATTAAAMPATSAGSPSDGATTGSAATGTEAAFVAREAYRGVWEGADAFHFAEGDALIIEVAPEQYILRVENFSVRNGPDLFVYLSPSPTGYAEGGLNLGELRATDGAFNYEIPPGTDLSMFESAVVWCERFAVLFATAPLAMR